MTCSTCGGFGDRHDPIAHGFATGGPVDGDAAPDLEHPAPFVFTPAMVERAYDLIADQHLVWTHPGRGRVCTCPLAGDHSPSAWRSPQALAEVGLTVGPGKLTPYTLCQSCGEFEHALGRCPYYDDEPDPLESGTRVEVHELDGGYLVIPVDEEDCGA